MNNDEEEKENKENINKNNINNNNNNFENFNNEIEEIILFTEIIPKKSSIKLKVLELKAHTQKKM